MQATENAVWILIVPVGVTPRLNADRRCTLSFYSGYIRTDLADQIYV